MSRIYPVGLVGESNYQAAIANTCEGEAAYIRPEPSNPYDNKALRVENIVGEVIGYISRNHWLRNAIHEEGRGVAATVKSIAVAGGNTGVVIDVTLTDDDLFERDYGE